MKRLILLRHAKSSWAQDGLPDSERPLSSRGEHDAPRMAGRLHDRGVRPDLVVSSPAVRARRTATLVAPPLGYPADAIRLDAALYLAAPEEILTVIAGQPEAASCLLLVGHNPGFTDVANLLLPELELANLPTAGAVVVDCVTERWSEVRHATRRLASYDYPKNLGPDATAD
jgi:phosphohistidine phosphatase